MDDENSIKEMRKAYRDLLDERLSHVVYHDLEYWLKMAKSAELPNINSDARCVAISFAGASLPSLGSEFSGLILIDQISKTGHLWTNKIEGAFVAPVPLIVRSGDASLEKRDIEEILSIVSNKFINRDCIPDFYDGGPITLVIDYRGERDCVTISANVSDDSTEAGVQIAKLIWKVCQIELVQIQEFDCLHKMGE
jgi:hypothetical protein